ncbi:helix-turn-helix transcriptional regulator [Alkalihalobacillus hemicellulosilyticus]|uniref:CBS domain protein n=1 Tax=Halalkalibacter hemicellulosilyticusJCM 9152 TaxID=1236971 RepID=W4QEV5_9BACI|nr:helix-turn-helix transcriptional regulator [Halalkalibacter hemicellulosilyticus]GAE29874.1 CBS domain protein [Halalkalibacter hemicellulosilyticusJCM 9152]
MVKIELSNRQLEIIEILKKHEPITAEQIAELLGVSRATLRSDLAVLVMTGYLNAKPKVGYFLGTTAQSDGNIKNRLNEIKVKDIQGLPVVIQKTTTVQDAVVSLFIENVGSLLVVDEDGLLEGIVSRKDLLKVTLGNANALTIPVDMVMTRHSKVVIITPEESLIEAARKMIHTEVDGLPVVQFKDGDKEKKQVVGRITKTNLTKVLLELATEA